MSAPIQTPHSSRTRHQSNQNPRRPKISLLSVPRPHSFLDVSRRSAPSDIDPADADDERVFRTPTVRHRRSLERSSLGAPGLAALIEGWPLTGIRSGPPGGIGTGDPEWRLRRMSNFSVGSALPEDDEPAPLPSSGAMPSSFEHKFGTSLPRSQPQNSHPSLELDLSAVCLAVPEHDAVYSYHGSNSSSRLQNSASTSDLLGSEAFPSGSSEVAPQRPGMSTAKPLKTDVSPGRKERGLEDARAVNGNARAKHRENRNEQENRGQEWSDELLEVLASIRKGVEKSVCKVQDRRSGDIMVRKTILTRTAPDQQLLHELQCVATKLTHQNLITYYGAYISPPPGAGDILTEIHILMEFCEGGTLHSIARQMKTHHANVRIREKVVARLAEGVLMGLDYMHCNKVTHGEINPKSIIVTGSGVVKLCNFGAHRNIEEDLVKAFVGSAGRYASPERIKGHSYSIRADVWSTGLTFLELVRNRLPSPSDMEPAPLLPDFANGKIPELDDDPGDKNETGAAQWSNGMKSFLKQCLCADVTARPTPREMLQHPWIQASMSRELDMAKWIRQVWRWDKPAKAKRSGQDIDAAAPSRAVPPKPQTQKKTRIDAPPSGITPDRLPMAILGLGADSNKLRKSTSTEVNPNNGNLTGGPPGGEAREIQIPASNRSRKKAINTRTPPPPPIPADKQVRTQPQSAVVGSMMDPAQIARVLTNRGCVNLTSELVLDSCSLFAVSNGGSGDVHSGELVDGTRVAIKVFRLQVPNDQDGKHLKHAAKELHTWSKCQHPNVIRLLGLVEFRGQIGMVSPWIAYGSVRTYLSQSPNANRRRMCYAISDGLAYLHLIKVIHGDLKGANVLVSNDGTPLLTDFGNSILSDQSIQFTKTSADSPISPRWTAPEVLDGLPTLTYSADIFSLGMTMLETITGNVPYHELKDPAVCTAILVKKRFPARPEEHLPTHSKRSNALWSLLEQCWAFEPKHRPSAQQVRDKMLTLSK